MGALIEQSIDTLFQGVSRQPNTIRLPGQVESGDNVIFNIVSGGYERRAGTKHIAELSGVSSKVFFTHFYERDAQEKYVILIEDGDLHVYDLSDGDKKTVAFPDGKGYLSADNPEFNFAAVTIADYTLIVNKTVTAIMDDSNLSPSNIAAGLVYIKVAEDEIDYEVIVNGNATVTTGTSSSTPSDIASALASQLSTDLGAGWTVTAENNIVLIEKDDGAEFTLSASSSEGDGHIESIKDRTQKFTDLPRIAAPGMIVNVTGDRSSSFDGYYVKFEAATEGLTGLVEGVWVETVAPEIEWAFDPSTMPHQLVRQSDGTFTFSEVEWGKREVGNEDIVPNPEFVDRKILDIGFHRDRLVLTADETQYWSRAGDYFNFWPEKAIDQLDSDPFGRTAPSSDGSSVNILNFSVPFRKALFSTSSRAQFETTASDNFGPRTAEMSPATAYRNSDKCRPITVGDTLYFVAATDEGSILFEYFHDESTLSNTASDASKHVPGYIPSEIIRLAGDSATDTVIALSNGDTDSLYIYQVYWKDSTDKAQSAWGRWVFGGTVKSMAVVEGRLYIIIDRGGSLYLETVVLTNEFGDPSTDYVIANDDGTRWPVRLDRRHVTTGSYDADTDTTTWTCAYPHDDSAVIVLGNSFVTKGTEPVITYPSPTTITATGDYSSGKVIIGQRYHSEVIHNKLFYRENNERTVTTGRLQVLRMSFDYVDTGYFEVEVTPYLRDTRRFTFNGREVGHAANIIGSRPVVSGTFTTRIGTEGRTVTIKVSSDHVTPFAITSASWLGVFNEISRQERSRR